MRTATPTETADEPRDRPKLSMPRAALPVGIGYYILWGLAILIGASTLGPGLLRQELRWIDHHVGGRPYGVDVLIPAN